MGLLSALRIESTAENSQEKKRISIFKAAVKQYAFHVH
jgi:hypothetical protein